jgi:hypothetical protein
MQTHYSQHVPHSQPSPCNAFNPIHYNDIINLQLMHHKRTLRDHC